MSAERWSRWRRPRHTRPAPIVISEVSGTRHDHLVNGTEVSIGIDAQGALVNPV